jgi:membrane-associated phospholipid phosphatase
VTRRILIATTLAVMTMVGIGAHTWARGLPGGLADFLGERFGPSPTHRRPPRPPRRGADAMAALRHWNEVAVDASGLDHTPVATGEARVFGEQLGPGRASRAMAIVHIAVFEAINAVARRYESYTGLAPAPATTSVPAAIAQAAHDTLTAMFPSQASDFAELLAAELRGIADGPPKAGGIELGRQAARSILALRATDGSAHAEPRVGVEFVTSDAPGKWRQDPVSEAPLALGAYWGSVTPFVLPSARAFRAPPPPPLQSRQFAAAYEEVRALGGDGAVTPTTRDTDETFAAIFWAYDGTPSLCAPPRLYNQITVQIAEQMRTNVVELARLLALVNVAMADAGIAIWESKYHYQVGRPVTVIREAAAARGSRPALAGDPTFMPLGAPASNLTGPNFTPPFPAYPSGHAGFGGALFQTLRNFYGTDRIPFTFVSDEYNGVTTDHTGAVRPLHPRTFTSLSEAEDENGQSRIYLGIHWAFDKTEGIRQGRRVADHVFRNAFVPARAPLAAR